MMYTAIEQYYKSNLFKPFLVGLGDLELKDILSNFTNLGGVDIIRISDFCLSDDKKPDLDKLRETLRMADVNCSTNRIVFIGLGEYLALEGKQFATRFLNELISFNLGTAHVVFLLRGVSDSLKEIMRFDPRVKDRQLVLGDCLDTELVFNIASADLDYFSISGIKNALKLVEEAKESVIQFNTNNTFPDSCYPVSVMKSPYEVLKKKIGGFSLPMDCGTESQWEFLLDEYEKNGSLNAVFENYDFDLSSKSFHSGISSKGDRAWLYYLYLIENKNNTSNRYLQFVLGQSHDLNDFRYRILHEISSVSHTSDDYWVFYKDRKYLISYFPDSDLAQFVSENRVDPNESIYKLTDNTLVEREEIIAEIAQHGLPNNLDLLYPDLDLYLQKYHFTDGSLSDFLTRYFDEYKHQKVQNELDPVFLDKVDELAIKRSYNRLRTRDEIIDGVEKDGSFLCWIDALGVEYLSFIVGLAKEKGLAISVDIGRASLPTITSKNKAFYEQWNENDKRKVEDLDDIKHHEKGGYKYGPSNKYAIHLAKELDIIKDVVNDAATQLGLHNYDRYIIASDHGASRLAVLRNKEEKYETDTRGEHSGRCCKSFAGWDIPFATEEDGFIVLADYGRFKGSRAANVEVHGGASLEEVLVPIVSLSLWDTSIVIKLTDSVVKADYKTGITFTVFVNKPVKKDLIIAYSGKKYEVNKVDDTHYKVSIPEIVRAGKYEFEIYLGANLVSNLEVTVKSKSASMNSDFDDLF